MIQLLAIGPLCLLFAGARWWYRRKSASMEREMEEFGKEFDRWEVDQELRRLSVYQFCRLKEVPKP